jgi:hypothetical protein
MVSDTLIRALVALLGEFSKKAGDVVAPVFPATNQIGEIPIKIASLGALVCAREMCQQPTSFARCSPLCLPASQWQLDSDRAFAKR